MFLYYSLALFVLCALVTLYLIPKIISVVQYKHLMDKPNERSSHGVATPSLGGIAFFIVLVIALSFNNYYDEFGVSMSILPGLTVLFFLGLKDDLIVLSAKTKLLGQIVACLFILQNSNFEINTLHGFLGIYEIPMWFAILMGLFLMLAIINSFNLIDGIDGLAGSIAIIIFIFFAFVFRALDFKFMFLSAICMIGIMIGFLYFNLSKRSKIFMGDTGSMQVGFIIAVMTVRLLAAKETTGNQLPFESSFKPIVLIALLIVPIYDATRVFIMRIFKGKSPFSANRDHFHHLLIDAFNLSHRKASFLIALFNILFLGLILLAMQELSIEGLIVLIAFFLALMTFCCVRLERQINRNLEKADKESDLQKKLIKPSIFNLISKNRA